MPFRNYYLLLPSSSTYAVIVPLPPSDASHEATIVPGVYVSDKVTLVILGAYGTSPFYQHVASVGANGAVITSMVWSDVTVSNL